MTEDEKKKARKWARDNKPEYKSAFGSGGLGKNGWANKASKLTDKSKVAETTWLELKKRAMEPGFKETAEYRGQDCTNRQKIDACIIAQFNQGDLLPLKAVNYKKKSLAQTKAEKKAKLE